MNAYNDIEKFDPSSINVEDLVCNRSFQAYCLGETDADHIYWEAWQKEYSEKLPEFNEAKRIVLILSARQGSRIEQVRYLKSGIMQTEKFDMDFLKEARPIEESEVLTRKLTGRRFRTWLIPLSAAAAILVFLYYNPQNLLFLQTGETNLTEQINENIVSVISESTPKKTILLSDGTIVTLRENSTLMVSENFNKTNREVELVGEAYFKVKHNSDKPFLVKTTLLTTTVLGTEFNVSAPKGNEDTEVILINGKVEVALNKHPNEKLTLRPNEKFSTNSRFDYIPEVTTINENKPEVEWLQTKFAFDNLSLENIASLLEKTYGIKIQFADKETKNYRYSGTFETEGLIETLDALKLSYPFKYSVSGQQIFIYKNTK